MIKVTTISGAIYIINNDGKVTGGSLNLKNGKLMSGPPKLKHSLIIETPERVPLRAMPPPLEGVVPAVQSSYIVEIKDI